MKNSYIIYLASFSLPPSRIFRASETQKPATEALRGEAANHECASPSHLPSLSRLIFAALSCSFVVFEFFVLCQTMRRSPQKVLARSQTSR